jgi:NitT/TauT family transport system substrate-binding protein
VQTRSRRHVSRRRLIAPLAIVVLLSLVLAACGSSSKNGANTVGSAATGSVTLRLGYFPNVTHAPAIIGVQNGTFATKLGPGVKLDLKTFNSGTEATTALLAGAIDASFVGPNPAINAYQKTKGDIRVVAGTASGGASFIVKPGINTAADLKGKKIGTPQAGNTQDVSLRTWLNKNGLHETKDGGDVTIVPEDNSVTLTAFESGAIDGAWVPEPWATRLQTEGGGKVLVNEKSLWPGGKFVTTLLMVKKEFLDAHPDVVQNLITGLADSIDLVKSNPAQAKQLVGKGIDQITGKPLKAAVIDASFKQLTFGLDPVASSLQTDAKNAEALGFLTSSDLGNIFDFTLLNKVLQARGQPAISS